MEVTLRGLDNPFPYAAYADPEVDPTFIFERKSELKELKEASEDYLRSGTAQPRTGSPPVIVTGSSGAGKTYLLAMLYHRVESFAKLTSAKGEKVAPVRVFVRRPAKSFLETYKSHIFPQLKEILAERKPSIYNRWILSVIERTGEHGLLTPVDLEELRRDPDRIPSFDERELFRRDVLLQALDRDILERAPKSEIEDFLRVFRHVYDLPLQALALKWLGGNPLEPAEREALEVSGDVTTDREAINLILMMSNIFAYAGVKFFFFLDELDVLIKQPVSEDGKEDFQALLRGLLEELPKHAFVIFASLEEDFENLGVTVKTRLRHIHLTNLDREQASRFLDQYTRGTVNRSLQQILEPKALEILVHASHGNPRQLLSLAHVGFRLAKGRGVRRISPTLLAEAQSHVNQAGKQEVRAKIAEWLRDRKLAFAEDVTSHWDGHVVRLELALPNSQAPELAFYFLSAAYLQSEAHKSIEVLKNLRQARRAWSSLKSEILVVDGYVTRDVAAKLLDPFEQIIYYDPSRYRNDLDRALRRFSESGGRRTTRPVEPDKESETLSQLRHELEQRRIREEKFFEEIHALKKAVYKGAASPPEHRSWSQRLVESILGRPVKERTSRFITIYVLILIATSLFLIMYYLFQPYLALRQGPASLFSLKTEEERLSQRVLSWEEWDSWTAKFRDFTAELSRLQSCRDSLRGNARASLMGWLPPTLETTAFIDQVNFVIEGVDHGAIARTKVEDLSDAIRKVDEALVARNPELLVYRLSVANRLREETSEEVASVDRTFEEVAKVRGEISGTYLEYEQLIESHRRATSVICAKPQAKAQQIPPRS